MGNAGVPEQGVGVFMDKTWMKCGEYKIGLLKKPVMEVISQAENTRRMLDSAPSFY